MKQIIFKDGSKERVIDIKADVDLDYIFYKFYRYNRIFNLYDFDWKVLDEIELNKLYELIPELKHFKFESMKRDLKIEYKSCFDFSIKLGKDTVAFADSIIKKFFNIINASEFTDVEYARDIKFQKIQVEERIDELQIKLNEMKQANPTKIKELESELEKEKVILMDLEKELNKYRNPLYINGISDLPNTNDRTKCYIKMKNKRYVHDFGEDGCKLSDKIKKILFCEFEKNPDFEYKLCFTIVFDYMGSIERNK